MIVRQCSVNLGKRQMRILNRDLVRVMPSLYQPAIRFTVNPVPAIFGRPPRIPGSLSISEPISTTNAMATVYRPLLEAAWSWGFWAFGKSAPAGSRMPYLRALRRQRQFDPHHQPGVRVLGPEWVRAVHIIARSEYQRVKPA